MSVDYHYAQNVVEEMSDGDVQVDDEIVVVSGGRDLSISSGVFVGEERVVAVFEIIS